ncbi:alkyl sulfatase C-terminal domain-containing protein, partial [Rhodococcus erythropolis]
IVHRTELSNGVLIHFDVEGGSADAGSVDATFSLSRLGLLGVLLGGADLGAEIANGSITVAGDPAKLAELAGHLDEPDPNFAIVTPT